MSPVPVAHGDRLAVIVGSSFDPSELGGSALRVETSRGVIGALDTGAFIVLARHHSTGARVPAHLVDHHAHLEALCALGVGRTIGLASVGSLRAEWAPGRTVIPEDFFAPGVNPTFHTTIDGHGVPGFDSAWRARVVSAWRAADPMVVDGGVYAHLAGPRFETKAEVRFLATVADIVGMTLGAEAILSGEVGVAYSGVCAIDNLANGIEGTTLTLGDYRAHKDANQADLIAALTQVAQALA